MNLNSKLIESGFIRTVDLIKRSFLFSLILLICNLSYGQKTPKKTDVQPKKFQAAIVKTDITPENPQYLVGYQERKSTGVNDRIYQKILLLDDGNTQFVLVSTEICILAPAEYDRVAS